MLSNQDERGLRAVYDDYYARAPRTAFASSREYERYRSDLLRAYSDACRCNTLHDAVGYFRRIMGAPRTQSRSPSPTGDIYSFQSVDPAAYLAALDQQQPSSYGQLRATIVALNETLRDGVDSGRSNQECVAASFATAVGYTLDQVLSFSRGVSSTDAGITQLANALRFRRGNTAMLRTYLDRGKRAVVRAPAMSGGGWHAYCAYGMTSTQDAVRAWDPDTDEQRSGRGCKKVPISLIDEDCIWVAP